MGGIIFTKKLGVVPFYFMDRAPGTFFGCRQSTYDASPISNSASVDPSPEKYSALKELIRKREKTPDLHFLVAIFPAQVQQKAKSTD